MRLFELFKKQKSKKGTACQNHISNSTPKVTENTEPITPKNPIQTGICGDYLYWKLDSEGLLTIFGNGPMKNILVSRTQIISRVQAAFESLYGDWSLSEGDHDSYSILPWYNGRKIRKAVIESGVTSVASGTFAPFIYEYNESVLISKYDHLTEITLSETVEKLEGNSISNCPELTKVVVPASVKSISRFVFSNCPKLTIHTPKGSYAEHYAHENQINVCLMPSSGKSDHPVGKSTPEPPITANAFTKCPRPTIDTSNESDPKDHAHDTKINISPLPSSEHKLTTQDSFKPQESIQSEERTKDFCQSKRKLIDYEHELFLFAFDEYMDENYMDHAFVVYYHTINNQFILRHKVSTVPGFHSGMGWGFEQEDIISYEHVQTILREKVPEKRAKELSEKIQMQMNAQTQSK